jgi:hypothetical protein
VWVEEEWGGVYIVSDIILYGWVSISYVIMFPGVQYVMFMCVMCMWCYVPYVVVLCAEWC